VLRRALERHAGRRIATARSLGITREALYKKMKRLNVE
jgi:transcriptional regulator of acetoin/glycerol metabolism